MDQVSIVVIPSVIPDAQLLFNHVIEWTGVGKSKYLADLRSEPKTLRAVCLDHVQDKIDKPVIRINLPEHLLKNVMPDGVEIFSEIESQDIALRAVFSNVLCQMPCASFLREAVAFVLHARAIVVDERPGQYRRQRVIAKASLDDPFVKRQSLDMPRFPSFENVKFPESFRSKISRVKALIDPIDFQRSKHGKPLDFRLPANASSAFSVGIKKMIVRENFFKVV